MAMHRQELYLHWMTNEEGGKFCVVDADYSCLDNWTLIAVKEVEFDIGEFDYRGAEVAHLEAVLDKVRAESQSRINLLLERISKLQAIGHEVEA